MNPAVCFLSIGLILAWVITAKWSGLLDNSWERNAGPFFAFWIPILCIIIMTIVLGATMPLRSS